MVVLMSAGLTSRDKIVCLFKEGLGRASDNSMDSTFLGREGEGGSLQTRVKRFERRGLEDERGKGELI